MKTNIDYMRIQLVTSNFNSNDFSSL